MSIVLLLLLCLAFYMFITLPVRAKHPEYSTMDWIAHFIKLMLLLLVITLLINGIALLIGLSISTGIVMAIRWITAFVCGLVWPTFPSTKTGIIPDEEEEVEEEGN